MKIFVTEKKLAIILFFYTIALFSITRAVQMSYVNDLENRMYEEFANIYDCQTKLSEIDIQILKNK